MRILIVGSGGREHALAWKLARDSVVSAVLCAPGNAGIASVARLVPADPGNPAALLEIAREEKIDLTVVGPELPLDRGLVDLFAAEGRLALGPTRAAARLESSKAFAKDFMARHGIPTARYRIFDDARAACDLLERGDFGYPVVVKADGLAAGKGVVVAEDRDAAVGAVRAAMQDRIFGAAGSRVVIEECLTGTEVSFFALCDGQRAVSFMSAQDHKRAYDGDRGPNTGGMGAFAPSPLVDDALDAEIMARIVRPVLDGFRSEGHEYRGFLYAGLMLTCDGPKVIEFNVRLGDPEAQVMVPMVEGDLAPRLMQAAAGRLEGDRLAVSDRKHVGVVLASAGYPGSVSTGVPIAGLDDAAALSDVIVFHAGTARSADGAVITAGGRVLTVVGHGDTFPSAIARAYEGVSKISFEGMQYRRDIGRKAQGAQVTGSGFQPSRKRPEEL